MRLETTSLAVESESLAVYVGLACTLILGIWPKPFMAYTVAATTIFSHLGAAPVVTALP